jgi:hypothetical protein
MLSSAAAINLTEAFEQVLGFFLRKAATRVDDLELD